MRLRSALLVLLALLYVAGIPGAVGRPLVIALVPAPRPVPDEVRERDGALDVVVRERREGEGPPGGLLRDAHVRAYALLDGIAYLAAETTTGADGVAMLNALPRAEHWVVAEAPGRARASRMVVVVAGPRRLDLELDREHSLVVNVVEGAAATPLAGAEIEVRGPDPFPVGGRTDARGVARIGRLGEGPYSLVVRAPGHEALTRRNVPEGDAVTVTLSKQGALVVHVLAEDGSPAAHARVLVASPSLGHGARVSETGSDGAVRIGGLDRGTYALRAVRGSSVSPIEIGVPLERGEEREASLRLEQGATATVKVVESATGEPVAKAQVTLAEGGLSAFPLEGVTDKTGSVVLGPVPRGDVSFSARAEGFVPRTAVRPENPLPSETVIRLARGGALVGRVRDARGFPVDGATVRVIGSDESGMPIDDDPQVASFRDAHFAATLGGPRPFVAAGELGVVPGPVPPIPRGPMALTSPSGGGASAGAAPPWVTGRDGTYRATPVTPGRVRPLVRHPQYVEALGEMVSLGPGGEVTVDVVLLRGGAVEGRVVDARGRPAPGVRVFALAALGSLERIVTTASDGSFAFASLPSAVTFHVSRDDDHAGVTSRVEVQVPEGGKKTIELTLPDVRGAVAVNVVDERGRAVEGAQVSAASVSPQEAARLTSFTGRAGDAVLAGVLGLPLRIEVHAPAFASKVVTVPGDRSELSVVLLAAESLSGDVWKNRRETLEGAEIVLQAEGGAHRARSDANGAFTLGGLSPGPARLRIRARGHAPFEREVVIEARAGRRPTALGRLELAEGGSAEGRVVDGRGDPVAFARVGLGPLPTYLPAGVVSNGIVTTDARGAFHLEDLPEGSVTLEAYAPDAGRARKTGVRIVAGRTTPRVTLVLARATEGASTESLATGGVAVTLGEARPDPAPPDPARGVEVVIVAVAEGSEAERAGLVVGDVLLAVSGAAVDTIEKARARLSGPIHDDVVVELRRGEQVVSLRVSRERVRR